jgi:hypothetical protein
MKRASTITSPRTSSKSRAIVANAAALSGSLFWATLNFRGIRALSEHKRYEARADLHVLGVGRSEI